MSEQEMQDAIEAMCYDCAGAGQDPKDCEEVGCALYEFRPGSE